MQTLTIGAYRATLAPTRDVGAFQAKLAKCNGKSRKSAIRDTRTKGKFPKFEAGMSTADYVRLFESWGTPCKPVEWEQLNSEPCTLYSGADTCETLPDGFDTWEDFDAAQSSSTAAESAPADAEPVDAAEPVAPDDAIAPAIVAGAEPDAPAPSARAEPYPGSEPQRMADAMRARVAPTADALREAAAELEARAARVPTERADDYRGAAAMLRADADAAPGIVPGFASRGARMLQAAIARSAARGIEVGAGGAPLATHSQTSPSADPLTTHSEPAPTVPDPEPAVHGEDVAAPVCAPADDEPAETGAAWFERIIAENKAKRDDCEVRAQKVAPLDSVPFKHSDGERFGIAGPCMSEPGRFRFSYFDSRGAIGHCTRDTLALAMWEALDLGYLYATEDTAPASPPATHSEPEKALPYAGFDPVRGAVYRAHIETAKHSRAIDPTFSGMLRRPRSAGFMGDFMAPEVRAHRNAIAAMVRACRAKRASVPLPADTGPLTTDTGADLGEQSAHRIGRESFERGEAMMSDASLRRAFGSQAERDAYYRGYDDAERAARPVPATHSDPVPSADPMPADSQDAPDVAKWRAELRSVEDAILRAAPARYSNGRYGCDIEAAARSRSVAADLKRQRKYLRASLRGARMMADAVQPAPVASAPPPVESAPLPGDTKPEALDDDETIPAPLDGLDVAELDDEGMAEFERATREQATAPAYRELTTAHYRPQGPCVRIPAYDARAMIPQRFAPSYLLRA